ncbi:MAG: hypothetical protein Q9227_007313 [Pyrenula ochraceoflavens]
MTNADFLADVDGNFPLHMLPDGVIPISAEISGVSAWTKTARIAVRTKDGAAKRYFLKCATGDSGRASAEGEYESALAINAAAPGMCPKAVGWGMYYSHDVPTYFYVGEYIDMELSVSPEPVSFTSQVAALHRNGRSPTGKFGFPVATVCGRMQRTVTWESSWAKSFTHQLKDVIKYDNETNGPWPEFDAACKQLIDAVIPRLLGILQSDGRDITPTLIHGDLWNRTLASIWKQATQSSSILARCTLTMKWNLAPGDRMYQRHFEASEPAEEWDDRNRLYSLHPYLNDSAGHAGSPPRRIAYNDMLYLCEKYAPLEFLEKYKPEDDIARIGTHIPHPTHAL